VILATTREELHEALAPPRAEGHLIGLVPTMGYLHEGHLSLVDLARANADFVAVSIFVNPLQFGEGEDLDRYPRDMEQDLALLRERGANLVFHPSTEEVYPEGEPAITVDPGEMGTLLCGAHRPGHFRGVLTVVARLFGLFRPGVAVFGRKDFQQAVLIQRMTRELEMGVEVLLGEIVREADGLALSSRNVYLTPEDRRQALGLRSGLLAVDAAFRAGTTSVPVLKGVLDRVMGEYPGLRLQYGEVVDPRTLQGVAEAAQGDVLALAGYCGDTRLIDNQALGA
jgi:pantoate--beta-alanine ligase